MYMENLGSFLTTMVSHFYTGSVPVLLCALFVIQGLEFRHSKAFTSIGCIKIEREALLKLKHDLTDPLRRLSSWTGEDCCEWKGVECSERTGHISKLDLHNPCDDFRKCTLGGKVHPALTKLKHLKHLDLSFNNFSMQQIPESLASLQKLEYLNLSSAGFYGNIYNQLGNISSLQYLDLSHNQIKTENLQWLSTFSSLRYLDLSGVYLINRKEWLSPISMLSSLEYFNLRGGGLEDASASPHANFTSLRFLDLSSNFLSSFVPPWFLNLSKLEHLDISYNDLQGTFPTAILESSRWLRFLDISQNRLGGELLKNMSIFCNLEVLNLRGNNFSGSISDTKDDTLICERSNLKIIDGFSNNFSGHLPNQFGNFQDLEFLDLSLNSIAGPIPATVGHLSSLRKLFLFNNKLSGNIPKSIGGLSNLELMHLANNQLDGVVSEIHFANLTSLTELLIYSNELILSVSTSWVPPFQIQSLFMSGCKVGPKFPNWLQTQSNISTLDMSNGSISDEVPQWLPDILSNINLLDLSRNMLRGKIARIIGEKMPLLTQLLLSRNNLSGGIPSLLCLSDELRVLDLSNNQLSGGLPQCWSKSQANLYWISLRDNKFNDQIPSSLCHLEGLSVLGLHRNNLNGVIPNCLLKLDLILLDLSDNHFTGKLPQFGQHTRSFRIIDLGRNCLTGDIPLQLCHLSNLQYLSLAQNNLSGDIPRCFNNFSQMWANSTFTPYYTFTFPMMVDIKGASREFTTTLRHLFSIDLSSNTLHGQIPKGLTRLARLQNLNFSQNNLIGEIPSDIGSLKDLESLDLSNNKLSGQIPRSISSLYFLSHLDLSFNNLSGPLPSGNQLSTLSDQFVYRGNDGLCGAPLLKVCPEEDHNDKDGQDGQNTIEDESNEGDYVVVWFYSGFGFGFAAALFGFSCILHLKQSWRISYIWAVDNISEKMLIARLIIILRLKRAFQFQLRKI